MTTRIFVSYASEDSDIALRLVPVMRETGAQPFFFQDKDKRGRNFIREIANGIKNADLFVAVMSPDYLSSYWCQKEWEMAMNRESTMERQFIYVCQVADTSHEDAGFEGTFDWLNLMPPATEAKIRDVVAALAPSQERPASVSTEDGIPQPLFHNRTQEITRIVDSLTTPGGHDFWLVLAPPRMGKSWFLERVAFAAKKRWAQNDQADGRARRVDLRDSPDELRSDWVRLLCVLLDVPPPAPGITFGPAEEKRIASAVGKRSCPQVYFLDGAELMTPECIEQFRRILSSIHDRIRKGANPKTRVSVVVASRQLGEWAGYGQTGRSKQFMAMELTEFDPTVIKQAVDKLGREFGAPLLEEWAQALHRLSEGLPALLAASLRWANENDFGEVDDCAADDTFETVARPYIREDLLSDHSLLSSDVFSEPRKTVLKTALQAITAYRLFTFSHLQYLLAADADFERELVAASWTMNDLWEALCRTALLKQPTFEVWQVLSPPIRRLLYRYYYSDVTSRERAHNTAGRFYRHWAEHVSDSHQCVALVEYLWHEAMALRCGAVGRLSELPHRAAELTRELVRPLSFSPPELVGFVRNMLRNDIEFSTLMSSDDEELFAAVQASIETTISGGSV